MNEMVRISARDMVAVALKPLKAGETVSYGAGEIVLKEDLPMGHKAALRDIRKGEAVIKYGYPIGEATADIPAGSHVHTHNLHTLLSGERNMNGIRFFRSRRLWSRAFSRDMSGRTENRASGMNSGSCRQSAV